MNCVTGSVLLSGIHTEIQDASTGNTTTQTNDEMVQVSDGIESDSESVQVSECNIKHSDFVVNDKDIPNLYQE